MHSFLIYLILLTSLVALARAKEADEIKTVWATQTKVVMADIKTPTYNNGGGEDDTLIATATSLASRPVPTHVDRDEDDDEGVKRAPKRAPKHGENDEEEDTEENYEEEEEEEEHISRRVGNEQDEDEKEIPHLVEEDEESPNSNTNDEETKDVSDTDEEERATPPSAVFGLIKTRAPNDNEEEDEEDDEEVGAAGLHSMRATTSANAFVSTTVSMSRVTPIRSSSARAATSPPSKAEATMRSGSVTDSARVTLASSADTLVAKNLGWMTISTLITLALVTFVY
ncbi:hypothetical protein DFQ30_011063 [Apophysomyces sp. BC1015]|nr:hypothetical protein DFQ30_011063 [Apophysomyces sp. BC1015]KAG0181147.1 hypothetical protein DFQ29_009183 [Apophysomyces sp. BC1021]